MIYHADEDRFKFILISNPSLPMSTNERNLSVYAAVCQIPYGYVATYGQIAEMAGFKGMARQVGYVLFSIPSDSAIPWHRVINARGEISQRSKPGADLKQRRRLEQEGIKFDERGRVSLPIFGWNPRMH